MGRYNKTKIKEENIHFKIEVNIEVNDRKFDFAIDGHYRRIKP